MPAFKVQQKNSLFELERGHKARAYGRSNQARWEPINAQARAKHGWRAMEISTRRAIQIPITRDAYYPNQHLIVKTPSAAAKPRAVLYSRLDTY